MKTKIIIGLVIISVLAFLGYEVYSLNKKVEVQNNTINALVATVKVDDQFIHNLADNNGQGFANAVLAVVNAALQQQKATPPSK